MTWKVSIEVFSNHVAMVWLGFLADGPISVDDPVGLSQIEEKIASNFASNFASNLGRATMSRRKKLAKQQRQVNLCRPVAAGNEEIIVSANKWGFD
jgi:hypothetical protein